MVPFWLFSPKSFLSNHSFIGDRMPYPSSYCVTRLLRLPWLPLPISLHTRKIVLPSKEEAKSSFRYSLQSGIKIEILPVIFFIQLVPAPIVPCSVFLNPREIVCPDRRQTRCSSVRITSLHKARVGRGNNIIRLKAGKKF